MKKELLAKKEKERKTKNKIELIQSQKIKFNPFYLLSYKV